jgi:hypothetical protein
MTRRMLDAFDIAPCSGSKLLLWQRISTELCRFRATTAGIAVLVIQAIASIVSIGAYDNYWIFKGILLIGASAGLLFADAGYFSDESFTWIARICGFAFIIFQQSILLDFAYSWNKSWVDKSGALGGLKSFAIKSTDCYQGCNSIWLCGLMMMSAIYAAVFIVAMSVLYYYYGGRGCGENVTIITVSLVLMLSGIGIQLLGHNGSIIASGIVAVYVSYLTYAAVSLNPDAECNANVGNHYLYGIGQFVIGIFVCFLSILWIAVITSRRLASLLGSYSNLGVFQVIQGQHSGTQNTSAREELEKHTHLAILNLSFVFVLICFYIAMIMTNWGTITKDHNTDSPTSGKTSMWMQAIGAWVAVGLYILGLIIPSFKILPESIWDLKFEFNDN